MYCHCKGSALSFFATNAFDVVIADEVHTVRNCFTTQAKALTYLSHCNPLAVKIGLTGTLYVNNIMDIQSVASFLMVPVWNQRQTFVKLDVNDFFGIAENDKRWEEMKEAFVVHRTIDWLASTNGLSAPKRWLVPLALTGRQAFTYSKYFAGIAEFITTNCHKWSALEYDRHVFAHLSTLNSIEDHPFLLCLQNKSYGEFLQHTHGHVDGQALSLFMDPRTPSDKMEAILKLLKDIKRDQPRAKVVIFFNRVRFIQLMSNYLWRNGFTNLPVIGSSGLASPLASSELKQGMSLADRMRNIALWEQYDDDVCVLLANHKCAGVGLNMYKGTHVIHANHYYNESQKTQAEMRVWRSNAKNVEESKIRTANINIFRISVSVVTQW